MYNLPTGIIFDTICDSEVSLNIGFSFQYITSIHSRAVLCRIDYHIDYVISELWLSFLFDIFYRFVPDSSLSIRSDFPVHIRSDCIRCVSRVVYK